MKKLFWVNFCILLILFSSVSCTSSRKDSSDLQIVSTAITLAEEKLKRNRPWQAVEVYEKARQEVSDYRLIYNEAVVYAKMGRYKDAIVLCNEGLESFPEETSFLKALASYYDLANEPENAKEYFDKFIALQTDDTEKPITTEYSELLQQYMLMCSKNNYKEDAYTTALKLWNRNVVNTDIIDVLYATDQKQWAVMHKVFPSKTTDTDNSAN